jgi:glutaminyl-tRNA synthetase
VRLSARACVFVRAHMCLLAHTCACAAPVRAPREDRTPSPFRDRSVEENLMWFERMKKGMCDEGECTLRMKMDITHPDPTMWDLVAYRVKYTRHPHVGDRWCIYPSYDYTHCIIDSLENITYSLCTLEFEPRREVRAIAVALRCTGNYSNGARAQSYFWLLERLNLYKPKVWEFSRLNVGFNVMSKRKLKALVEEHIVRAARATWLRVADGAAPAPPPPLPGVGLG